MPKILAGVDCALFPKPLRRRHRSGCHGSHGRRCARDLIRQYRSVSDLIEGENCLSLKDQRPVAQPAPVTKTLGLDGWGESSVDEMVSHLETLYRDSEKAHAIGLAGAQRLSRLTWPQQIDALIAALGPLS